MKGFILLVAFLIMATISAALASTAGLIVDNLPHVHDLLSVLTFFGTLVILLPISWLLAVRLTEPRNGDER